MAVGKTDHISGPSQPLPVEGARQSAPDSRVEFPKTAKDVLAQRSGVNSERLVSVEGFSRENASIRQLLRDVDDIEEIVEEMGYAAEQPVSSLSKEINIWGNEEVSLLYHEYVVAKKITGTAWTLTDTIDTGVTTGTKTANLNAKLSGALAPELYPLAEKIERDMYGIALAYKIPANLGKISVLIYKRIFISRAQDLLNKNPPGMSDEQKTEFKAFLKVESKEISGEAKQLAIDLGTSLPKKLLTVLRLCKFNMPMLHLSLTWIDAVLGPVLGCYELYQATKDVIKAEKDIAGFKAENFRRAGEVEARHANAVINTPADFFEQDFQNVVDQAEKLELDEGRQLLEEAGIPVDESISSKEELLEAIHDPDEREVMLGGYLGTQTTADKVMEKAVEARVYEDASVIRTKRRDALLDKRDEPEPGFDTSYGERFDSLIDEVRAICQDPALGFNDAVKLLIDEDINIDPDIKNAAALLASLDDPISRENMLARYIDVKSNQPMTDSVRNALKTLTMKKQIIKRNGALKKLMKSKVMLTAAVATCIFTVAVTGLISAGVAIPLAVLFTPSLLMLGIGAVLVTVGLVKFYQNSPNLFMEYVKGSFVKIAAYNIPKSIQEVRKGMVAMRMLKNSLATGKLSIKAQTLAENDPQQEAIAKRREKLERESAELERQLARIEEKIVHWEEKIKPIAKGIAMARWQNFLQSRPKRVRTKGRGLNDQDDIPLTEAIKKMPEGSEERMAAEAELNERLKPLGAMKPADASEEILQSLTELRDGIIGGKNSPLDEDIRKIVKERLGLDLETLQERDLQEALLAFAP